MSTFLTALGISILIVMVSVLWVLISDVFDNKKKENN